MSVAKLNSSALRVLAIRSDCDVGGIDGVDRAGIGDFNNCKDGGEGSMAEDNVDCVNFFFFFQASVCALEQENCELERKVFWRIVAFSPHKNRQPSSPRYPLEVRLRTEEAMAIRRELLECQRMLQSSEALLSISQYLTFEFAFSG